MRVRVAAFGISLDGYSAGPDQSLENPLGVRGPELMEWAFHTRFFHAMQGKEGGETGVDNRMCDAGFENVGAWILGRNMFGPVRGPWPDESWRGWWGEEPPYHVPVFVLTHHTRPPLVMKGGTTFQFFSGDVADVLGRAKAAAAGKDVRIGGGTATVRQFLQARLIDEMHLAVRPALMGKGENLFAGLDLDALGYACAEVIPGERATHVMVRRR